VDFRQYRNHHDQQPGPNVIQEIGWRGTTYGMKSAVMESCSSTSPRVINGVDDIVVFHPLDTAQIRDRRHSALGLRRRLLERDIELTLDVRHAIRSAKPGSIRFMGPAAQAGHPAAGENPLAQSLLGGVSSGRRINATVRNGALVFEKSR